MTDRSEPTKRTSIGAACFLVCLASVLTASQASAQLVPAQDAPRAEAASDSYNAHFALECGAAPDAELLLGVDTDAGLMVSLDERSLRVSQQVDGRERALGSAQGEMLRPDASTTVRVRKRPWSVSVDLDGRPVLTSVAFPGHGGLMGLAEDSQDCMLTGAYVQPIESFRLWEEFFPDEDAQDRWEPVSGDWTLRAYRDPLVEQQNGPIAASWYEAAGDVCLSVTGFDFWEDCAIEASGRTDGGHMGVVLGYSEAEDPILFEISADSCRITRGGPDGEVLAEGRIEAKPGTWHRLRLEGHAGGVRALVDGDVCLEAPVAIAPGRVGLYASGERVEFDDVLVESIQRFVARPAPEALESFTIVAGRFGAEDDAFIAHAASCAIALARAPEWPDAEAQAMVRIEEGVEAGVLAGAVRRGYGYALGVERDGERFLWRLRWLESASPEVLAVGDLPARADSAALSLRLVGSRVAATIDGVVVAALHDFRDRGGRTGIYADGARPAYFGAFESRPLSDSPLTVASLDGSPRMMLDPRQSGDVMIPEIGYRWAPVGEGLTCDASSGEPVLRPGGGEEARGLRYYEPCAGDIELLAVLPDGGGSGAVLSVFAPSPREPGVYQLRVRATPEPGAELLCRGEVVARAPLEPGGKALPLSLRCDGPHIIAQVGEARMTHHDAEPARSGYVSILTEGADAPALDDVEVIGRTATEYTFGRVVTEWGTASGRWETHSGMSCIPLDYWITGYAEPKAELVSKSSTARDCLVRVSVSEYTEGYESGEHRHFPYHDFGITLGRRPGEPSSGYRFVIGADGGREVRLLREGELVASADDERFRIAMGGHCNTPRTMDVVVERSDGELTLRLQGRRALTFSDPSPLPTGCIALSVEGCQANFRDLVIYEKPAR